MGSGTDVDEGEEGFRRLWSLTFLYLPVSFIKPRFFLPRGRWGIMKDSKYRPAYWMELWVLLLTVSGEVSL